MQLVENAPLEFEQLTESEILNILGCGESEQDFAYTTSGSLPNQDVHVTASNVRSFAN